MNITLLYYFRVMAEHTFLQLQHIHALEMEMPWLLALEYHSRFLLYLANFNIKLISYVVNL
jgi:hypothetical protein